MDNQTGFDTKQVAHAQIDAIEEVLRECVSKVSEARNLLILNQVSGAYNIADVLQKVLKHLAKSDLEILKNRINNYLQNKSTANAE